MEITFWLAFGAGLLSFLSPCVIPLVPVYLASLAGPEILDSAYRRSRFPTFLHSLFFVAGFSLVFIFLGAAAGLVGFVLSPHSTVVRLVAGGLMIVFGLLMLVALKVPWLNYERRLSPSLGSTSSYLRSLLIGAIFPVAWIPCTSWVLGGILMMAGASETAGQGACLLAFYSLGVGLPFLAAGIAFDLFIPLLKNLSRFSSWIYIAAGLLLIIVGVLILTDNLNLFITIIPL